MLTLNDLLEAQQIDPNTTLVFRHKPFEAELNKALPRLAEEKPDVFNVYQQFQGEKLESAMRRAKHVVSFVGRDPGEALFIGLYSIDGWKSITREDFWKIPGNIDLKKHGMTGADEDLRDSRLQFDLQPKDFHSHWKGKLIIRFPPQRSWWRWAHGVDLPILAILQESRLVDPMPDWDKLALAWMELADIPISWEDALRQWRAVYYILDRSDRKAYVGSAYGDENLLGRWKNYADSGHGGNRLLRERNPKDFVFTILQRVSPDMDRDDVVRLESTWKDRLHTRAPLGLNDN